MRVCFTAGVFIFLGKGKGGKKYKSKFFLLLFYQKTLILYWLKNVSIIEDPTNTIIFSAGKTKWDVGMSKTGLKILPLLSVVERYLDTGCL